MRFRAVRWWTQWVYEEGHWGYNSLQSFFFFFYFEGGWSFPVPYVAFSFYTLLRKKEVNPCPMSVGWIQTGFFLDIEEAKSLYIRRMNPDRVLTLELHLCGGKSF